MVVVVVILAYGLLALIRQLTIKFPPKGEIGFCTLPPQS